MAITEVGGQVHDSQQCRAVVPAGDAVMEDGGYSSGSEQGAEVEVSTPTQPPILGDPVPPPSELVLRPLAPLAPLPTCLGGNSLARTTPSAPPPPLASLPQLFGEDFSSLLELNRRAGSTEMVLMELHQALQKTRQEGNHTFNELGKYLIKVEEAQAEQWQQYDQHISGGMADINTVLHSHHDRHHQVEDRLSHLRNNLHQLLSEQH